MSHSVNKIGLILKQHDPRVRVIVADIVPWLRSRGIEIYLDKGSVGEYPAQVKIVAPEDLASNVDVVAVFGGDGTLLYAARLVAESGVPILGVNLGSLGFLTEVTLDEMHSAFEALLSGSYHLEERILLEVEVLREGEISARYLALNDAIIAKSALARIIEIELSINSQLVTVTRADGLIISTPTGSTGYNLSAGGPILYPTLEALILTPICPHTLTNRPVVVPDDAVVGVRVRHSDEGMLTVDGQVGMSLAHNDSVRVRKANSVIRLVQPAGKRFFVLLREKLKWG
jgi:NAD+ kinase